MQTVRDLLYASLRLIGVMTQGYTPTATEMNDALYVLNENMDSWNANGKNIFAQEILEFPVDGTKDVWTIGPGGDLNTPVRPQSIQVAAFKILTNSPPSIVPLAILSAEEWANIQLKETYSSVPQMCYLEPSYPLAKFHLWPLMNTAGAIQLTMWSYLNAALTLDTIISFPPGYARLMRYNVAIAIAPEYGLEVSDTIKSQYSALKLEVQTNNVRTNRLTLPVELAPGVYNAYTDSYTMPQS